MRLDKTKERISMVRECNLLIGQFMTFISEESQKSTNQDRIWLIRGRDR